MHPPLFACFAPHRTTQHCSDVKTIIPVLKDNVEKVTPEQWLDEWEIEVGDAVERETERENDHNDEMCALLGV